VDDAIERVILTMQRRLGEPMTVDDLARTARFSKFHFTRIFQRATGVSPGRFLSAMRLNEAKRLLITTSMTVTEISYRVGYNSVGTFTSRFSASVGLSPTEYRRRNGYARAIAAYEESAGGTTVMTVVHPPATGDLGPTFVGVFPTPIPEGRPVRCAVLDEPRAHRFEQVPAGRWYLLSALVDRSAFSTGEQSRLIGEPSFVGTYGPFDVHDGVPVLHADIRLQPVRPTDPPILLALVDVSGAHGGLKVEARHGKPRNRQALALSG
jgi:AraC-like DNA-binding protein